MGIVIGAMLMLVGLTASTVLEDEAFTIETQTEEFDEYPGNESWNFYGTLNGSIEEQDGDLLVGGTNGTYTSDIIHRNTTILVDQVVYETQNIRKDDSVELFVEYFDSDGTAVGSEKINITEDINSYAFADIEEDYTAYKFKIVASEGETGQHLRINSLTFTIDVFTTLTDDLPFDFSSFLTIVPFLLGLIIEVASFTTAIIRLGD